MEMPAPTEAGHTDFAARTPAEIDLLVDLTRAHGRVDVARVLSGPGLVWPVRVAPGEDVSPEHLSGAESALRPGDILIIDTGSHRAVGTPAYEDHPALSVATARWIVDHDVKLVGVDTPTPDAPVKRRPADFDYPVHRLLLGHGVLIAEQLTNLGSLSGRRVEVVCNALNIAGSDGAPARILARTVDGNDSL